MASQPLFKSFLMGGIECSTHRLVSRKRIDVIAATQHDRFIEQDYARMMAHGIRTIRSGFRWHLIEQKPGVYDFSSALPQIRAAERMGMQVIWDLCHYGWPHDLDIFTPAFVDRFGAYCEAIGHVLANETSRTPFVCPVNEISFFSWGAGDAGYLNPFWNGRGFELKVQLTRAAIAGIEGVWREAPDARIVHVDPIINVITDPGRPHEYPWAEGHRVAQFQAWDMLTGRLWPAVGGHPKYLDIVGVNYYHNNQWIHAGPPIHRHHPLYRRFRHLLQDTYERYARPIFIAETGIEFDERPVWFEYMAGEALAAMEMGVPLEGMCWYPIINHPGWDDDRHTLNGLWDYADEQGDRPVFQPLSDAMRRMEPSLTAARQARIDEADARTAQAAAVVVGQARPRVLLFTDSLEASGMGEHMITLAEALQPNAEVTLVMPPSESNARYLTRAAALGIEVQPMTVRGGSAGRPAFEALRDLLRAGRYDVFHAHAGVGYEGHDGVYAALFSGVPSIVRTEHLPYVLTHAHERIAHRDLLRYVDEVIVVSQSARESFLAAAVPDAQITAIHNGIYPRLAQGTRSVLRRRFGFAASTPIVLTAGRFTDQKGYHVLVDALPTITAARPDARFVWAGDGPQLDEITARIEAMGLAKRVRFLGWRSDVPDLLGAADLFVMPSRFEGFPLALLEAMANGCPIVSTRVGGVPEMIEDGEHGQLVDPNDPAALASAVIAALEDDEARRVWAQAGRARVMTTFSAQNMARETLAVYVRLLAAKTGVPFGVSAEADRGVAPLSIESDAAVASPT